MHKTNHACCWCTDLRLRLTKANDMELCPNPECKIKEKASGVKDESLEEFHIRRTNKNKY